MYTAPTECYTYDLPLSRHEPLPISVGLNQLAIVYDPLDAELPHIVDDQDIGEAARRDAADQMIDAIGLGGIDGRHLDGRQRRDPHGDRHAQDRKSTRLNSRH